MFEGQISLGVGCPNPSVFQLLMLDLTRQAVAWQYATLFRRNCCINITPMCDPSMHPLSSPLADDAVTKLTTIKSGRTGRRDHQSLEYKRWGVKVRISELHSTESGTDTPSRGVLSVRYRY